MRKDVECVFGILKKRFLFLKHPIWLHEPEQIENAFVTCCVLHNLLLDCDGYDDWELRDVNWEGDINVEHTKLEEHSKEIAEKSRHNLDAYTRSEARRENQLAHTKDSENEKDDDEDLVDARPPSDLFHERRSILIDHYKFLVSNRGLKLNLR